MCQFCNDLAAAKRRLAKVTGKTTRDSYDRVHIKNEIAGYENLIRIMHSKIGKG